MNISRRKFECFLRKQGLTVIRTTGGHTIWNRTDKPLSRPVIMRSKDLDVPELHVRTTLKTLEISKDDFLAAISDC